MSVTTGYSFTKIPGIVSDCFHHPDRSANVKIERHLTEADKSMLEAYRFKTNEVKAFVAGCIRGTNTGLLLFGSGGTGKSWTITTTLKERSIKEVPPEATKRAADDDDEDDGEPKAEYGHDAYVHHQGRCTPKGLATLMEMFPKCIHLVEDAETLMDDKNAMGLLRNALASQDEKLHPRRHITWVTSSAKGSLDFDFWGSIIFVGNRELGDDSEELKAVKTRAPTMAFNMSNAEIEAKMKEICLNGYKAISGAPLTADDCFDVLEFILDAVRKGKKLNIRQLTLGFRYLAFSRLEEDGTVDWKEMLLSQMTETVGAGWTSRAARISCERAKVKELMAMSHNSQHDKLVEWCKMTQRDLTWADYPKDSAEYRKGFNSAKTDLSRKSN